MHPSLQMSHGAMLLCLNFLASGLGILLFFAVGCRRSEAAVGPQSDNVSWKPLRVGERSGRIPQSQPDCPGHGAHAEQLLPWSVKYCDCHLLLKQDFLLFQIHALLMSRLPIPPRGKGAQGRHQGLDRTLHWRSARFVRSLYLHNAQGAGQTDRYGLSAGPTWVLIDCCFQDSLTVTVPESEMALSTY